MPIFTLLASFIITGTFTATGIGVSLLATGLALATSIGVSYAVKALAGDPEAQQDEGGGVRLSMAAGADVPRSFQLGRSVTAGSLVYANTWGALGGTPNAYLTQVIALSDMPGCTLAELWVNGEKCTISGSVFPAGNAVTEYYKDGFPYLFVKFYDGTQTTADSFLTGSVSSAIRPYQSTRVGTGICYAILTSAVQDTLFTGVPQFKFVMDGIPLYDPSKDSTVGGSGSHVYSTPATWGGDGDDNPAVQAYNLIRGIRYNGAWLYGLQNIGAARLPAANWIAQINKCRTAITGLGGPEPTYRSGGQISIDVQPANAIEALLTACQGRLSEIGGFYKIYLGTPDASAFAWTDADLLSSEQQTFRPFFSLADSVNGIQGTYPDPAQGWETATAPALYRTDLEVRDGNRRLMASPAFNFVPYPEQVQRLQKSAIEESQRARSHVIAFPPAYWIVEPGDIGTWNSTRNGYVDKLFRVDTVTDRGNLDVIATVTEIDPSDYDWDHVTDYTGVATGPTAMVRPAPQGVVDWTATGTVLYDNSFLGKHAAIRITWDGTLLGIVGVQYEVRLTVDASPVCNGRTDQYSAGALIISQGILPLTQYQVRGQYIPSAPRDMLWSGWIDVTTPAIMPADVAGWITEQVTNVMDYLDERLLQVEQRLATLSGTTGQRNWEDLKQTRSQLDSRTASAFAEITRVETVATSADAALASDIETLTATVGDNTASIEINATAIAQIDGFAAASYSVTLDVNDYATGFQLLNGGPGVSATIFTTDKFQIAAPGVGGGAPREIFTVANVAGSPKVGIRGDMYVDGSIAGVAILASSVTADRLVTGTIDAASGAIANLAVKTLQIADNAVTVPQFGTCGAVAGNNAYQAVITIGVSINTAGLSGKTISVLMTFTGQQGTTGAGSWSAGVGVNGGLTGSPFGGTTFQPAFAATAIHTFTATGGTDSFNAMAQWFGTTGALALQAGTLTVTTVKR